MISICSACSDSDDGELVIFVRECSDGELVMFVRDCSDGELVMFVRDCTTATADSLSFHTIAGTCSPADCNEKLREPGVVCDKEKGVSE